MRFLYQRVCGVMLGVAAAVTSAHAAPVEIKINSSLNSGSFAEVFLKEFERRVEADLVDEVDIQIFMGGVLGSEQDVLSGLKLGTHHATLSASRVSAINRRAAIFDLPYLFASRNDVQEFLDSDAGDMLRAGFEGTGAEILAIWDNGFRIITNNVRPIATPADLDGLKIRTPNSRYRVAVFETLGANPTPLSFSEVYSAMDQGVVDGQENPGSIVYSAKFYEVQDYASVSNHVYLPTFLLVSEMKMAQLSKEARARLREIAAEMGPWTRDWGVSNDAQTREQLEEAGMAVNDIDFAAFQAASAPLYDSDIFVDRIGAEMIEATLEAVTN